MDILQRLKRHLVMSKFATQQDLYAEMDADRRDAAEEIEKLRTEVQHWKSNHATEIRRARILKERTDMPMERVQAYDKWGEDQKEIELLRRALDDLGVTPEEARAGALRSKERQKNANRYMFLWNSKFFVPNKDESHALFQFRAWCTKEIGDSAIDAAITERALQDMTDNAQALGLYDVPDDEKR